MDGRPRDGDDLNQAVNQDIARDDFKPTHRDTFGVSTHSRSCLRVQAVIWRFLMSIGMCLHGIGWTEASRPPRPTFVRQIPFATRGRTVSLYFYCPPSYWNHKRHRRSSIVAPRPFPVVVNFHGGGFTLGHATDDAYWAKCVMEGVDAVFVSVDYRKAPEYPFPAAVDDGVDALLYLAAHAGELGIDASRIAVTGFSSGGNLAVTVPLRLYQRIKNDAGNNIVAGDSNSGGDSGGDSNSNSNGNGNSNSDSNSNSNGNSNSNSDSNSGGDSGGDGGGVEDLGLLDSTAHLLSNQGNLQIIAIFAWYPLLDFVASRAHRRASSLIPGKTMPPFLTTLFDESYLPNHVERSSPFASPERASDELLRAALPHDMFLYTCEWDMLLQEGQRFVRRLDNMGKKVRAMMVEQVPHAWDKSPNPFRDQGKINVFYEAACAEMKAIFDHATGHATSHDDGACLSV